MIQLAKFRKIANAVMVPINTNNFQNASVYNILSSQLMEHFDKDR